MKRIKITDEYTNGPQPNTEELKSLSEEGFKSVVNLRTLGEENQPISPEDEGRLVREMGLQYLHIPVSMNNIREEQVDEFRKEFAKLPKPAFGHCLSGKRSGALTMMHLGIKNRWSGAETLQKSEELGFPCDDSNLREFVKRYIDSHQS